MTSLSAPQRWAELQCYKDINDKQVSEKQQLALGKMKLRKQQRSFQVQRSEEMSRAQTLFPVNKYASLQESVNFPHQPS